jgi:hypothetical protein
MAAAPSPKPLTFTLQVNGQEVREHLTSKNGRRKVYHFPYTTTDQQEIDYLLKRGAKATRPKPVTITTLPLRPAPPEVSYTAREPLEGGDEK